MSVVTITKDNVEYGPCQVTFGGQDLGAFKGGVTISYTATLLKSKPDQLSSNLKAFVQLEAFMVTVPLLETAIAMMQYIMPFGTYVLDGGGTKKKIEVGGDGVDQDNDYKELILTPTSDGSGTLSTNDNELITVHRALAEGSFEKGYNMDGERTISVEFHAYADTTKDAGNQLMTFGDTTASA